MANIELDTNLIRQYADMIDRARRRAADLDYRIEVLYNKTGLVGLLNLVSEDTLARYTYHLSRCRDYLIETAYDFESVEKMLSTVDPISDFAGVAYTYATAELYDDTEYNKDSVGLNGKATEADKKDADGRTGAVIHGEAELAKGVTAEGSVLTYEVKGKGEADWDIREGEVGAEVGVEVTGAVTKGSVEAKYGPGYTKVEGEAITGAVSGQAYCTLFQHGRFDPRLGLKAEGEISGLKGTFETGIGDDQFGANIEATGDLLYAKAKAEAGLGRFEDKDGNMQTGAIAEAGAMASLAKGEAEGGFTLFGIKINVGVEGYAGAVGGEVGGYVTTSGVRGHLSGAFGLGGGLDLSIDWSEAEWVNDIADFAVDVGKGAVGLAKDIGGGVADAAVAVWDWITPW